MVYSSPVGVPSLDDRASLCAPALASVPVLVETASD
jgi:hypothetical protein